MNHRSSLRRLLASLATSCMLASLIGSATAIANEMRYHLKPRQIAADTWVVVGTTEDFSMQNGGNIVNMAFIDTGDGVIVIDSGSTRRHGLALRQAIALVTASPIREVWITHHHPDHFLGNQAFADVPIAALPATTQGVLTEGNGFLDNIYRLTGDWAKGTEIHAPNAPLEAGTRQIGSHRFRLLALRGHTAADLAVFDETTGVLFTGDLAFHDRAPTTPHAAIRDWLASLDALAKLPYRLLVPGHGEPSADDRPLRQTRRWLQWLEQTLARGAADGLDATEMLAQPIPGDLADMAQARSELARSVAHLFGRLEAGAVATPH